MKEVGVRFDGGKLRYDLTHPVAQEGLVRVLTKGADKYSPRNWEKGMAWSKVIASAERHLAAFKKGIDYDQETGELHIDHLQCNIHFLSAYYKIAPEFDDRNHSYLTPKKISLDIDEVICDWRTTWCTTFSMEESIKSWSFDPLIHDRFKKMKDDDTLEEFYLNLPPIVDSDDIPFIPHCYITSRPCSAETTVKWLMKNGFPLRPVMAVPMGSSKVEMAKAMEVDIHVDDAYHNFLEMNNAGICTFLYDSPHNHRHEVGYKRIKSLKELHV